MLKLTALLKLTVFLLALTPLPVSEVPYNSAIYAELYCQYDGLDALVGVPVIIDPIKTAKCNRAVEEIIEYVEHSK